MTKIDKPNLIQRLTLLVCKYTVSLSQHWPDSVKLLYTTESLRQIRLSVAELKRNKRGRKMRINSTNKKGK